MRVIDKLAFGRESIEDLLTNERFQLVVGDIRHVEDVTSAMADIEAVIDLAAIVGAPACDRNGEASVETNYYATRLLAQVANDYGVRRLLFASTCSVYGASESMLNEESPTSTLSLYAETKLKSEQALMETRGNLEPVILRMSTLCGPSYRMRFDLVLNVMTASAMVDGAINVFGGKQWRPLLDVRDASRAFAMILEEEREDVSHQILNVGSEKNNIVISDLARLISRELGDVPVTTYPRNEDPRSYKVDFSKIRRLGFETQITLNESVRGVKRLFDEGLIDDYRDCKYNNTTWVVPALRPDWESFKSRHESQSVGLGA